MNKLVSIMVAMLMVLSVVPLALAQEVVSDAGMPEEADAEEPTETAEIDGGGMPVENADLVVDDQMSDETVEETTEETEMAEEESEETEEASEDEETEAEIPEEVAEEAGVTPDSPLYGIERALERISLALTLGKSAKAKKGLAHAAERLAEVQVMQAAKKNKEAAIAAEAYEEIVAEVEGNVEALSDGDAEGELQDVVEIIAELEEQEKVVNKILGSASEDLKAKLISLMGSVDKIQVRIKDKERKTQIKIKAQGKTDEEIEALTTDIKGKSKEVASDEEVKAGKADAKATTGKGKKAVSAVPVTDGTVETVVSTEEVATADSEGVVSDNSEIQTGEVSTD